MAYLFCEEHGREHVATAQADQDYYQFLGETIVIASGAVKSPSWRCHRCNLRLRRRMKAYLVTAFPRGYTQNLDRYDYRTEQEYFRLETLDATVYGAEPPGGWDRSLIRQRFQSFGRQRSGFLLTARR
jgi:hypothetical protein